ncbi:MAG: hypothetical protein L0Z53_11595, partial [Acidobacteriales bacterium]|nr:hypothetical protein [Terriglobales bacterium]
ASCWAVAVMFTAYSRLGGHRDLHVSHPIDRGNARGASDTEDHESGLAELCRETVRHHEEW